MSTVLHVVCGYFFLLLIVRLLSRRPGGQLTPFEFVIVFLIGGLIIAATVGDDKSATNCVSAILTVCLLHRATARLRSFRRGAAEIIDGTPLVLLDGDQWKQEAMEHMRVDAQDVMTSARAKGLPSLDKVRYAVLERVGSISILEYDESPVQGNGNGDREDGVKRG